MLILFSICVSKAFGIVLLSTIQRLTGPEVKKLRKRYPDRLESLTLVTHLVSPKLRNHLHNVYLNTYVSVLF